MGINMIRLLMIGMVIGGFEAGIDRHLGVHLNREDKFMCYLIIILLLFLFFHVISLYFVRPVLSNPCMTSAYNTRKIYYFIDV